MKVSLKIIEKLIGRQLPAVDELVNTINKKLGGVEEVTDFGLIYRDAVIVRVKSAEKHPDADRLTVCMIDAGRDELVQVVCGAPNVSAGMWAVWLPPESIVPSSAHDAEPFKLSARELRGVMSNGMLAAGDELAINNDHEGIIELTSRDLPDGAELAAGASFAEVFELNDTIIDIENKMFTHRPDCFGQMGVAREVAGILGEEFVSPDWYLQTPEFAAADKLTLSVENSAPSHVSRFMAVAIDNVTITAGPLWLQLALVKLGSKPINNVVDLTNYYMLMTAQPTHAYDYDKLRGQQLNVRMATEGEQLTLINGKSYSLATDDIVIADAQGAIGLAGVMGGLESEVTTTTTRVVLEVATFDMYAIRRTSMRHGLFTDAVTRFNKGQSPRQNDRVLAQLIKKICNLAGGEQASNMFDRLGSQPNMPEQVVVSPKFIRDRLGGLPDDAQIEKLLTSTEFAIEKNEDEMKIRAPFWRTDIDEPEDIVEEVGRLYGFDELPRELPLRSMKSAATNQMRELKQQLRINLAMRGAHEVLTYSFVHQNVLESAEQNIEDVFGLSNALSPDLQYYRATVLPSLLDKVHANIKAGHDEFVLFEIGKGHSKTAVESDGLPAEQMYLDAVYAAKRPSEGAAYFYMRELANRVLESIGLSVKFAAISDPIAPQVIAPFEQNRSAQVVLSDGTVIGVVGEIKQTVAHKFKLPEYAAAMSFDVEKLLYAKQQAQSSSYQSLSRYPSTTRDISLIVDAGATYNQLEQTITATLEELSTEKLQLNFMPISIYAADNNSSHRTYTFRITLVNHERTLTEQDATNVINQIVQDAKQKLQAELG